MSKITFIIGGTRSGKSSQAVKIAKSLTGNVGFVATCEAQDPEMKERIKKHQSSRPSIWQTFELKENLSEFFKREDLKPKVFIVDCNCFAFCKF